MKFLLNNVHIINLLIILEVIIILNFFILLYLSNFFLLNCFRILLFFIINVIESCIGLGILIFLSRNVGEEYKFIL